MLAEEPDVRKALVRFREGLGGNLRGAPSLLDLRLVSRQLAAAKSPAPQSQRVSNQSEAVRGIFTASQDWAVSSSSELSNTCLDGENGLVTVTPLQVNPSRKSSESNNRQPASAAAERITASQMPRSWSVARSAAPSMTEAEVSIRGKASRQLMIAARAFAGERPAFRTSTLNSSPSVCIGRTVVPSGSLSTSLSANSFIEIPLTPSA